MPPDAVLIGCIGDPDLLALRQLSDAPVLGLAQASLQTAHQEVGANGRHAVITGGQAWVPMLHRLIVQLGLNDRLSDIRAVDKTGVQLAANPKAAVRELAHLCEQLLATDGALKTILLGGAALGGLAPPIQARLRERGVMSVELLDSVAVGLRMAVVQAIAFAAQRTAHPVPASPLLVSHASVHVYATATRRVMPFDPVNDFAHLGMLVEAPMVLLVRPRSPYQTLEQYVTAAKTKPVRYGSSGIGSANHLFGEMLKLEGKAPLHDHIPYQGSSPAMLDLLGGQIDSLFDPVTTNVTQLKAGSLRALAVSTPARLPALPNIPTFAELGYPKLTGSQWLGLSAPKGLPAPIAQRLTALIPEMLAKPDVVARLEELQTLARKTPVLGNDFVQVISSQIETWRSVAKQANVEVIT